MEYDCGEILNVKKPGGKIKDLTGMKFGKLTVIKYSGIINHHAAWECKCECGNTAVVRSNDLHSGNVKSCGCLRKANGLVLANGKILCRRRALNKTIDSVFKKPIVRIYKDSKNEEKHQEAVKNMREYLFNSPKAELSDTEKLKTIEDTSEKDLALKLAVEIFIKAPELPRDINIHEDGGIRCYPLNMVKRRLESIIEYKGKEIPKSVIDAGWEWYKSMSTAISTFDAVHSEK